MADRIVCEVSLEPESIERLYQTIEQFPDEELVNIDVMITDYGYESNLLDFACNFGLDRARTVVHRIRKQQQMVGHAEENEQIRVSAAFMNEMVDIIAPDQSEWVPKI